MYKTHILLIDQKGPHPAQESGFPWVCGRGLVEEDRVWNLKHIWKKANSGGKYDQMLAVVSGKYECESLTFLYLVNIPRKGERVGENFVRGKESYTFPLELWRVLSNVHFPLWKKATLCECLISSGTNFCRWQPIPLSWLLSPALYSGWFQERS